MVAPIIGRHDRRSRPASPIRLTELTDCGGCAAKLGADLLAEALAGLGAEAAADATGALIAGLDPARRRRRLPGQRRPGDHRHARLLPAARRRPADVRRDRRRERPVRRLRDGRPGAVRAVDRGVPRGAAAGRPGRDLRRRLGQGPRGRRHARRRPHDPRPGAEVRAGGRSARPIPTGCCARAARGRATCSLLTKRLGTGRAGQRPPPGPDERRPTSRRPIDQMRTLNRAASEVLVAAGVARARPTSPGFGLLGHGLEMARASGTRFVFEAAALPALAGRPRARGGRRRDRRRRPQPAVRAPTRWTVGAGRARPSS